MAKSAKFLSDKCDLVIKKLDRARALVLFTPSLKSSPGFELEPRLGPSSSQFGLDVLEEKVTNCHIRQSYLT